MTAKICLFNDKFKDALQRRGLFRSVREESFPEMIGAERARVVKFRMDMLLGPEVTLPIVPTELQNLLMSDMKEFLTCKGENDEAVEEEMTLDDVD